MPSKKKTLSAPSRMKSNNSGSSSRKTLSAPSNKSSSSRKTKSLSPNFKQPLFEIHFNKGKKISIT